MNCTPKEHKLPIGETIKIKVCAGDKYSAEVIIINKGEKYHVHCPKAQRWVDMFIPASPEGYTNPLADLVGQRVRGAKCFCLCGAYNNSDDDAFAISSDSTFTTIHNGALSFFPNDVKIKGFNWNNWGSIEIFVERVA